LTRILKSKGFTLVELMIVIAIIAILVTMAVPRFSAYRVKAYNAAALSDLKNVKIILDAYYIENKFYP